VIYQGPFSTLREGGGMEKGTAVSGQAVGLLSNIVGKDSVLAISTKDGQVRIYGLADEIQPAWDQGKQPQVTVDDKGHLLAIGMLVESSGKEVEEEVAGVVIPGRLPPLLPLGVLDLLLQPGVVEVGSMSLFADPVVPERLYCQHAGGLDVILVQWLPFSAQNATNDSSERPTPAVFSVLEIQPVGNTIVQPPLGVTLVLDSLGESWVVAVTANCECAVINMKPHRTLPEPIRLGVDIDAEEETGYLEVGVLQMMSKELLSGPKDIPLTQVL
jgi:nuclear pore complex protein Nup88